MTNLLFTCLRHGKRITVKCAKLCLFPLILYRRYRRKFDGNYFEKLNFAIEDIKNVKDDYLIIHNPDWLGVTSATIELFNSRVRCGELLRKKDVKLIINYIPNYSVEEIKGYLKGFYGYNVETALSCIINNKLANVMTKELHLSNKKIKELTNAELESICFTLLSRTWNAAKRRAAVPQRARIFHIFNIPLCPEPTGSAPRPGCRSCCARPEWG